MYGFNLDISVALCAMLNSSLSVYYKSCQTYFSAEKSNNGESISG